MLIEPPDNISVISFNNFFFTYWTVWDYATAINDECSLRLFTHNFRKGSNKCWESCTSSHLWHSWKVRQSMKHFIILSHNTSILTSWNFTSSYFTYLKGSKRNEMATGLFFVVAFVWTVRWNKLELNFSHCWKHTEKHCIVNRWTCLFHSQEKKGPY